MRKSASSNDFVAYHRNLASIYLCTGNSAGATWLNKTSTKNDMFTRLHEDPMLIIKQNEKKVHFDYQGYYFLMLPYATLMSQSFMLQSFI